MSRTVEERLAAALLSYEGPLDVHLPGPPHESMIGPRVKAARALAAHVLADSGLVLVSQDELAAALDRTPGLNIGLMLPDGHFGEVEQIAAAILHSLLGDTETPAS